MGKVTKLLSQIRPMNTQQLFDRFKRIVRAQAVREYIGAKEDMDLTIEVNLVGEEVVRRMASARPQLVETIIKK